jgi:hypothetical protein
MARFSLAALAALDRSAVTRLWMTTRDAARMLGISRFGVWWLARKGDLPGERTVSGQWLFRQDVVRALRDSRAQARLRRRPAVLRAARLRLVAAQTDPRQLELFTAHGGVVPAVARAAAARSRRKVTQHSLSATWAIQAEMRQRPIISALSPSEGPKHMAKVEEPHGRDIRRAGGRRR